NVGDVVRRRKRAFLALSRSQVGDLHGRRGRADAVDLAGEQPLERIGTLEHGELERRRAGVQGEDMAHVKIIYHASHLASSPMQAGKKPTMHYTSANSMQVQHPTVAQA